ncbi:MAG: hypothetical protein WCX82_03505 [archaeon]|jgi:hypothetical protein
METFPYPLSSDSCETIRCNQVVEHLKPWLIMDIFDEMWRILIETGKIYITTPVAGSFLFELDPTHTKGWTKNTIQYFDPRRFLYSIYRSKPWLIRSIEEKMTY